MNPPRTRVLALTLLSLSVVACGKSAPELTPQQQINRDFADLTWTLMEPLKSSDKCHEVGAALAAWEKVNGARYRELTDKITTLHGADAKNFSTVERRFKNTAMYCIHPKGEDEIKLAIREHDADVERVYAMFPKMQTSYELR